MEGEAVNKGITKCQSPSDLEKKIQNIRSPSYGNDKELTYAPKVMTPIYFHEN